MQEIYAADKGEAKETVNQIESDDDGLHRIVLSGLVRVIEHSRYLAQLSGELRGNRGEDFLSWMQLVIPPFAIRSIC
jgi:hypothetical protein